MNVVLHTRNFDTSSIYFTDTKVNTHIPNSTFNRITYSTSNFMMNGVYFNIELNIRSIEKNFNSNVYLCYFDPESEFNSRVIKILDTIENDILRKWTKLSSPSSSLNMRIQTKEIMQQMNDGMISVWKHDIFITDKPVFHTFIIKIAGVWENDTECGLTYKFI